MSGEAPPSSIFSMRLAPPHDSTEFYEAVVPISTTGSNWKVQSGGGGVMIAPLRPVACWLPARHCGPVVKPKSPIRLPRQPPPRRLLGGIRTQAAVRSNAVGTSNRSNRIGVGGEGGLRRRSLLEDFFAAAGTGGGGGARLGDHVEAGATLLVIDSSDITAAYPNS